MADRLTKAERDAIEDFDGPVTRIPLGVTALDLEYRWDGATIRATDRQKAAAAYRRGFAPANRRTYRSAAVAKRRDKVRRLVEEGLSGIEIARRLCITRKTVGNDLAHMGLRIQGKKENRMAADNSNKAPHSVDAEWIYQTIVVHRDDAPKLQELIRGLRVKREGDAVKGEWKR